MSCEMKKAKSSFCLAQSAAVGVLLMVTTFTSRASDERQSASGLYSSVDSRPATKRKRIRYESPQAVLTGCVNAVQKKDWRTFMGRGIYYVAVCKMNGC